MARRRGQQDLGGGRQLQRTDGFFHRHGGVFFGRKRSNWCRCRGPWSTGCWVSTLPNGRDCLRGPTEQWSPPLLSAGGRPATQLDLVQVCLRAHKFYGKGHRAKGLDK